MLATTGLLCDHKPAFHLFHSLGPYFPNFSSYTQISIKVFLLVQLHHLLSTHPPSSQVLTLAPQCNPARISCKFADSLQLFKEFVSLSEIEVIDSFIFVRACSPSMDKLSCTKWWGQQHHRSSLWVCQTCRISRCKKQPLISHIDQCTEKGVTALMGRQ